MGYLGELTLLILLNIIFHNYNALDYRCKMVAITNSDLKKKNSPFTYIVNKKHILNIPKTFSVMQ